MFEQDRYPYIEGSRGISFKGVRTTDKPLVGGGGGLFVAGIRDVQELKTGSGRRVIGRFTPTSIEVVDVERHHLEMNAFHTKGELILNIRTHDFKGRLAQPDFFAGRFVTFALHNLQVSAGKVDGIRAIWYRHSANFQMFTDALDQTSDVVEAARKTWTGKIAQANGFDVQARTQVEIDERNEDTVIRVLFTPTNTNAVVLV